MYYNRRIAFSTLGCKLNYAETSAIARKVEEHGFQKVDFEQVADYYIINTCSVTENADKQTKQFVKNALKTNPEGKIVIIGCYAQLKPEEIAAIPGVALVLGAKEKFNLHTHLELLTDATTAKISNTAIDKVMDFNPAFSFGERTRGFLKIQDGCDYKCSFCTIPMARGSSRSQSIENTVAEAKKLAALGVKEAVLAGVNIGDYGKTPDGQSRTAETFFELIKALDKIDGIERWRISSIEPNLLTDEIIDWVANSTHFLPHFHIPLQSGSDRILKFMRRKYLTPLYQSRIEKIKKVMPHACIGVDVIVGFPGETEEEFLTTYNFINSLDISYLHVFTYSERANTKALQISPIVPIAERKKRNEMLRILSEKKKNEFYTKNIGSITSVLWENATEDGTIFGFTENYVKVATNDTNAIENKLQKIKIQDFHTDRESMQCEILLD